MDMKAAVLFCALLAGTAAIEKYATKETEFKQDTIGDRSIDKLETDKNFEDLLTRMEHLEAREKIREQTYMNEIKNLRRQLSIQTRRTSSLERLVKSMPNKQEFLKKDMEKQEASLNGKEKRKESPYIQFRGGKEGQRIRRAENHVAFFATLSHHLTNVGAHQPITFDNVVTNIGNAYNSHLGSFIAPESGTYVFSVTLLSEYHLQFHANFVKNGHSYTKLVVSGTEADYGTMSQTIVLQLQKGDDVCVQNYNTDGLIYGNNYSIFSGFLL